MKKSENNQNNFPNISLQFRHGDSNSKPQIQNVTGSCAVVLPISEEYISSNKRINRCEQPFIEFPRLIENNDKKKYKDYKEEVKAVYPKTGGYSNLQSLDAIVSKQSRITENTYKVSKKSDIPEYRIIHTLFPHQKDYEQNHQLQYTKDMTDTYTGILKTAESQKINFLQLSPGGIEQKNTKKKFSLNNASSGDDYGNPLQPEQIIEVHALAIANAIATLDDETKLEIYLSCPNGYELNKLQTALKKYLTLTPKDIGGVLKEQLNLAQKNEGVKNQKVKNQKLQEFQKDLKLCKENIEKYEDEIRLNDFNIEEGETNDVKEEAKIEKKEREELLKVEKEKQQKCEKNIEQLKKQPLSSTCVGVVWNQSKNNFKAKFSDNSSNTFNDIPKEQALKYLQQAGYAPSLVEKALSGQEQFQNILSEPNNTNNQPVIEITKSEPNNTNQPVIKTQENYEPNNTNQQYIDESIQNRRINEFLSNNPLLNKKPSGNLSPTINTPSIPVKSPLTENTSIDSNQVNKSDNQVLDIKKLQNVQINKTNPLDSILSNTPNQSPNPVPKRYIQNTPPIKKSPNSPLPKEFAKNLTPPNKGGYMQQASNNLALIQFKLCLEGQHPELKGVKYSLEATDEGIKVVVSPNKELTLSETDASKLLHNTQFNYQTVRNAIQNQKVQVNQK